MLTSRAAFRRPRANRDRPRQTAAACRRRQAGPESTGAAPQHRGDRAGANTPRTGMDLPPGTPRWPEAMARRGDPRRSGDGPTARPHPGHHTSDGTRNRGNAAITGGAPRRDWTRPNPPGRPWPEPPPSSLRTREPGPSETHPSGSHAPQQPGSTTGPAAEPPQSQPRQRSASNVRPAKSREKRKRPAEPTRSTRKMLPPALRKHTPSQERRRRDRNA